MLWSSWHNHTGDGPRFSYCADEDLGPDAYRRLLRQGPWQALAITDHAFALALPDETPWPHQWFHQPARLREASAYRDDKTARYLERMAKVCDGERLFSGLEVEVAADGSLSMDSQLWPYLHVVIGSIHYLPGEHARWADEHFAQLDMLLHYPIDILGHPFRALSGAGDIAEEVIDETLRRAKQAGVAVEINAHIPFARDAEVLARAVRMGLQVAFALDAHHRHELQLHTYFETVLARSGVDPADLRLFRPGRKTPKPRVLVR